ncbi:hypothetical protein ILUMI_13620 [Ignelater luminosus]|uniref:pyridoxal 5'-phosphate synthase n=1 Tax=Ignelater luminosus TaxID=2038154 RepID=A0A8K0G5N0_IGNLU|nr:hypothetical protein ILUMI_13620 [Ignelater luminosus]
MDISDISGIRKPYNTRSNVFLEKDINVKNPFDLFDKWFQEARSNPNIVEPNAMCLSTATRDGKPSARFMLCKGYGKEGFQFYTHYTSRKGQELEANPNAALTFFWPVLSKSVRIEGPVEKLPPSYAEDYFKTRPYQSQVGALCSNQSKVIESRECLVAKANQLKEKYKEGEVPKPESWGGFIVVPAVMEFWQGQTDRVHDRIKFRKLKEGEDVDNIITHPGEDNWIYERLQP